VTASVGACFSIVSGSALSRRGPPLLFDVSVQSVWICKTYFAALISSTPSIFTKEQLGLVLRLPRWNDKCLPFTYTADRISLDAHVFKVRQALAAAFGECSRLWLLPEDISTVLLAKGREMGCRWSKMGCRRGCCSPSRIGSKVDVQF
jgi:hypothetical protein